MPSIKDNRMTETLDVDLDRDTGIDDGSLLPLFCKESCGEKQLYVLLIDDARVLAAKYMLKAPLIVERTIFACSEG